MPTMNDTELVLEICCRCVNKLGKMDEKFDPLLCDMDDGQMRRKCARCANVRQDCLPVPQSLYSVVNIAIQWHQELERRGLKRDKRLSLLVSEISTAYAGYNKAIMTEGVTALSLWRDRELRRLKGEQDPSRPVPVRFREWLEHEIVYPDDPDYEDWAPIDDRFPKRSAANAATEEDEFASAPTARRRARSPEVLVPESSTRRRRSRALAVVPDRLITSHDDEDEEELGHRDSSPDWDVEEGWEEEEEEPSSLLRLPKRRRGRYSL